MTEDSGKNPELSRADTKVHGDDEVLVEDSWFHRSDLPVILGNFMRSADEAHRATKVWAMRAEAAEARAARVRALHRPRTYREGGPTVCGHCDDDLDGGTDTWPCYTIAALDGDA